MMMKRYGTLFFVCVVHSISAVLVKREDFFTIAMGIDEKPTFQQQYDKDPKTYLSNPSSGAEKIWIRDGKDAGVVVNPGYFEQVSVGDLRKKSEDILKNKALGGGTFNVIEAINPSDADGTLRQVDIGAMQADPKYRDAFFQVASNFNALELVSKNDQMTDITNYTKDLTQGPFASIAAPYALIYRHYYMFNRQYPNDPTQWKQTPAHQINFLDKTDIPVTNSYVDFSKTAPGAIKNFAVENIKVGTHRDVRILFGYMPNLKQFEKVTDPRQKINQIFTAAVDFGSNWKFKTDDKAIKIAKSILDAAYEGTIRVAFVTHQDKLAEWDKLGGSGQIRPNNSVVLTLVGGGVFQNDFDWIADAIVKNKDFIVRSGMHVELVIFNASQDMAGLRDKMRELVKNTGGYYTQYSKDNPTGKDIVIATSKPIQPSTGGSSTKNGGSTGQGTTTTSLLDAALNNLQKALHNLMLALQ
jgi:hypothetical protein